MSKTFGLNQQKQSQNSQALVSWDKLFIYGIILFVLFSLSINFYPNISWLFPISALIASFGFTAISSIQSNEKYSIQLTLLPFCMLPGLYAIIVPYLAFSITDSLNFLQILILYIPFTIYIFSFKIFGINYQNIHTRAEFINSLFCYFLLITLLILVQRIELSKTEEFTIISISLYMLSTNYLYNQHRRPLVNFLSVIACSAVFLEFWIVINNLILSKEIIVIAGLIFFHFAAGLINAELNKKLTIAVILEYLIVVVASSTVIIYLESNKFFL